MQFVTPTKWDDAVDKIGNKSLIGSQLNSEEWADVPVGLRERAFFSSKVESIRFLQRARDFITDFQSQTMETLPNGEKAIKAGGRAQFVKELSEFAISEGMGPIDAHDAGTLKDITSESRLKMIFDITTQSANDFAYWKQGMNPDVLDEFPAQRFIREREVKTPRIYHQQNENVVRLKTDLPFWLAMNKDFGVPWGPWGYNSGMGVQDEDRDVAEQLGLLKPGEKVKPIEKDFNDHLEASTQGLDQDMVDKLKEDFGDQIEVEGDTVRWAGSSPAPKPNPVKEPVVAPDQQPTPAPAPAPAPPTPQTPQTPESLDDVLTRLDLHADRQATAKDMTKLMDELKETAPVSETSIIKSVKGDKPSGIFEESRIRSSVQEFLNFIPPRIAQRLPKLDITVRHAPGEYGSYGSGGRFNLSTLLENNPDRAKSTIFHELMHWVHREGPQEYRNVIRSHFEERTIGERKKRLPGYGRGTVGKEDDWYEPYAGRIYDFEVIPEGLEIPTRYIEWLTFSPEDQAAHWNDPKFRETMKIVLKGLF